MWKCIEQHSVTFFKHKLRFNFILTECTKKYNSICHIQYTVYARARVKKVNMAIQTWFLFWFFASLQTDKKIKTSVLENMNSLVPCSLCPIYSVFYRTDILFKFVYDLLRANSYWGLLEQWGIVQRAVAADMKCQRLFVYNQMDPEVMYYTGLPLSSLPSPCEGKPT